MPFSPTMLTETSKNTTLIKVLNGNQTHMQIKHNILSATDTLQSKATNQKSRNRPQSGPKLAQMFMLANPLPMTSRSHPAPFHKITNVIRHGALKSHATAPPPPRIQFLPLHSPRHNAIGAPNESIETQKKNNPSRYGEIPTDRHLGGSTRSDRRKRGGWVEWRIRRQPRRGGRGAERSYSGLASPRLSGNRAGRWRWMGGWSDRPPRRDELAGGDRRVGGGGGGRGSGERGGAGTGREGEAYL